MRTSIVALAAALRSQEDGGSAAGTAEEKTYARSAEGSARPSTEAEAAELAQAEEETAKELEAGAAPLPGLEKQPGDMSKDELLAFQHELVALARDLGMAGSDIVERKMLRNKADGIRTVRALHARIEQARQGKTAPIPVSRRSAGADRERASTPTTEETTVQTSASETTTPRKRKARANGAAPSARKATGTRKEKTAKAPKLPSQGRRSAYSDGAKISLLVEGNPKREGSMQHEQWKLYREGGTVGTFLSKFKDQKDGRIRLNLDIARGLVQVTEPK